MAFALTVLWKDHFGKPDRYKAVVGKEDAWKVLEYAERGISSMKPAEERAGCIEFVQKAADLYFHERYKQDVPQKYVERVAKLEERAARLDAADEAEKRLTNYGEPRKALQKFKDEAEARKEQAKFLSRPREAMARRLGHGHAKEQTAPGEKQGTSQTLGLGF